jgi:hypothetical protein
MLQPPNSLYELTSIEQEFVYPHIHLFRVVVYRSKRGQLRKGKPGLVGKVKGLPFAFVYPL